MSSFSSQFRNAVSNSLDLTLASLFMYVSLSLMLLDIDLYFTTYRSLSKFNTVIKANSPSSNLKLLSPMKNCNSAGFLDFTFLNSSWCISTPDACIGRARKNCLKGHCFALSNKSYFSNLSLIFDITVVPFIVTLPRKCSPKGTRSFDFWFGIRGTKQFRQNFNKFNI
ncbi:hypothetical protein PanWU01x14_272430, partial [Parasponia andersonii]